MLKRISRSATILLALFVLANTASAQMAVIDPANLLQTTVTAAKAVKAEVYETNNIIYQYQMLSNQLSQMSHLNGTASAAQIMQITADIGRLANYAGTMNQMYGGLMQNGQYVSQVQSLVTQSGKTPAQWYADQSTLLQNGDANAKQLFQQGVDIQQHTQQLAQRRADIQNQLNMTPTQQATAQLTTHELDMVASQQSDMLQLMATNAQHAASAESASDAIAREKTTAQQSIVTKQQQELQGMQSIMNSSSVGSSLNTLTNSLP
jgi:hypothetical protein